MPRLAYVDGRFTPLAVAAVGVEDRGLQFADSVYEVVAVLNGRLLDWPEHVVRLARNLGELGMAAPMGDAALALVARRLIAANRATEALLYLQVTRGTAKRDHAFAAAMRPTLVMTIRSFDFAQRVTQQAKGVSVVTTADERWGRCDIKTTGLLANVLAKQGARSVGAFEAWLVGADGSVAEGASTNAWIVTNDGTLVTPPLSPRVLPGVMRAAVIAAARERQITVEERTFTVAEAHAAAEALLTSTTVPVLPVVRIDGVAVGSGTPGPVAARLAAAIWERIAVQTGFRPG
jgi:D-alanine transaminase